MPALRLKAKLTKKLSRREIEAVTRRIFQTLQQLFMEMELIGTEDMDAHRLLICNLHDVGRKFEACVPNEKGKYRITLCAAHLFTLRVVFAGQLDFTDAAGAWLMQLCNEVDQKFSQVFHYEEKAHIDGPPIIELPHYGN